MMLVYAIIGVNVILSLRGFRDFSFFERYKFEVDSILIRKEQIRMLSSGFLHVDMMHLIFNMYAFYTFSGVLVSYFTTLEFAIIYFGSLIGGNLLSLYIHRNHGNYSAVGASGAVSGAIYASIALVPDGGIGLVFLPGLWIPSWIFGIIYILYTIFGIKSNRDNIGHEAHLGGAMVGLILTVLFFLNDPTVQFTWWIIGAMLVPTLAFLYLVVYHPEWLLTGKIDWSNNPLSRFKDKQDRERNKRPKPELNELLDKINRDGYESLTIEERKRLDELSR